MTFSFTRYNAQIYLLKIESPGTFPLVSYVFLTEKMRADLIKKLQKPDEVKKDE